SSVVPKPGEWMLPSCHQFRCCGERWSARSLSRPWLWPAVPQWLHEGSGGGTGLSSLRHSVAGGADTIPSWRAAGNGSGRAGNPLAMPSDSTSVQCTDGLHAHPASLSGHHVLRNDRNHEVRLVVSPLAQLADLPMDGSVVEAHGLERVVVVIEVQLADRRHVRPPVFAVQEVQTDAGT